MLKALWKEDKELGIAYFCPKCKTFICTDYCYKCKKKLIQIMHKNMKEELNGVDINGRQWKW